MTRYLTPEQFMLKAVGSHPSLYAYPTYEQARFAVMDHVFNTLGNGLILKDFLYEDYNFEDARKYLTGEKVFYGYHKDDCKVLFINDDGSPYYTPESGADSITVLDSERVNYPDHVLWIDCGHNGTKNPYPYFKKTFSMVYDGDFDFTTLGQEWFKEAIWYYQQALKYFESDDCKSYHYAFPYYDSYQQRDLSHHRLEDFKKHTEGKYESYEALSNAYGVTGYDGDDYAFLCKRWNQEHNRIKRFIADTIEMLETHLTIIID
jgi:hypothetical protein